MGPGCCATLYVKSLLAVGCASLHLVTLPLMIHGAISYLASALGCGITVPGLRARDTLFCESEGVVNELTVSNRVDVKRFPDKIITVERATPTSAVMKMPAVSVYAASKPPSHHIQQGVWRSSAQDGLGLTVEAAVWNGRTANTPSSEISSAAATTEFKQETYAAP